MKHKKHGSHPHDKMAAMPQFHEGHWQKDLTDVSVADTKYSNPLMEEQDYKKSVDALASYVRKHKAQH